MTNRTALFSRHQPGGVFTIEDVVRHPGAIFFVHSGTGTDAAGNGKNPDAPLDTLDYAVGLCTANKGDVIYVMPNHSETLTAAGQLNLDVAGISIIGLGQGEDRPIFLLDVAATTDINVTAASITLKNVVISAGHADVAVAIDLDATDFTLEDVEFRDNATNENFVVYIDCDNTDNACDRLTVRRCTAFSPDTGNDHFIAAVGDIDRLTVEDCWISIGVADGEAIIEASTGKDFTNCLIRRNAFFRLNTANVVVMESDTTDNTGLIYGNVVGHADAAGATPYDVTGARLLENYAIGVVDASGLLLPAVDDNS